MGARPVKLTVNNNTSQVLKYKSDDQVHGKYTTDPPREIESTGFWACSARDGAMIGPKGTVTYEAADKSFTVEFFYNHPYGSATSSYTVKVTPKGEIGYDISGDHEGHDQSITFELYNV